MPVKREAESELSLANRELERYQAMTERERLEFNMERAKDTAVKTDLYGGPSSNKKPRMMGLGGKNLLQIYMERLERYVLSDYICFPHYLSLIQREANKKHVEFAGRRNLGEIAKLYIRMEAKEEIV